MDIVRRTMGIVRVASSQMCALDLWIVRCCMFFVRCWAFATIPIPHESSTITTHFFLQLSVLVRLLKEMNECKIWNLEGPESVLH